MDFIASSARAYVSYDAKFVVTGALLVGSMTTCGSADAGKGVSTFSSLGLASNNKNDT